MKNFPDSGWLTSMHKVEWWMSASIVGTVVLILTLSAQEVLWLGKQPPNYVLMLSAIGILFFFLSLRDITNKVLKERRNNKVRYKFHRLADNQRQLLMQIFQTGSRHFELPSGYGSQRWIEDLQNWNYIKWHEPIIITSDSPDNYSITDDGWRQLEEFQHKLN